MLERIDPCKDYSTLNLLLGSVSVNLILDITQIRINLSVVEGVHQLQSQSDLTNFFAPSLFFQDHFFCFTSKLLTKFSNTVGFA